MTDPPNYHHKYRPYTVVIKEKPLLLDVKNSDGKVVHIARCRLCGYDKVTLKPIGKQWWRGVYHYCVRGSIKRVMWTIDTPKGGMR